MNRRRVVLAGVVLTGLLAGGALAQFAGVPADLAAYRNWTKMNGALLADPSNPRAGPKNTFITLSPQVLRALVASGGRVHSPFPAGTAIVRETLDVAAGFVRVLFVMRKDPLATSTRGWKFEGYSRSAADQPFQPIDMPDPVARCLNCHLQVGATDLVFTPFTNRSDPLPARMSSAPDRVETFNFRFGPETLRVRPGATVVWVNYDAVPHDIKAADGSFESGNLPTQGRYFQGFDRPGAVDYFCALHLEMRGRIIVEP
jgi:plastocyanin